MHVSDVAAELAVGTARAAPRPRKSSLRLSSTVQRHERGTIIRLRGVLCGDTAPALREVVLTAMAGRPDRVVLDMTGMVAGDELGPRVLPALADDARHHGVALSAAVPSPRLRARLRLLGGRSLNVLATVPALGPLLAPVGPPHTPPSAARAPAVSVRPGAPDRSAPGPATGWQLDTFFAGYGHALARGDAAAASRCHHEPTYVTAAGTVLRIATRTEIERSLAELATAYRALGLVWARLCVESLVPVDERHCKTTVRWCHGGTDERPKVYARYRYLVRGDPTRTGADLGPRITTVTLLDGPVAATPPKR